MAAPISSSKGFVFERPDGTVRFVAHVSFDDEAVRRSGHPHFDGMERVRIEHPRVRGGQPQQARHCDTSKGARPIDVHTFAISLGRDMSLAKLMELGFDVSARINSGGRTVDLGLSKNVPIDDVGKVDESGIAWMSPIRMASGFDTGWRALGFFDLRDGHEILHSHVPLEFQVDVFAPELTPSGAAGAERIAQALGIRVEADFIDERAGGFRFLDSSGWNGNDARLIWKHAGPIPYGEHQLRFYQGDRLLQEITISRPKR